MPKAPHIYRWDMDKTYLKTDFDTIKDLIKTAFQRPADKANVPGSADLLKAVRMDAAGNAEIYFISGSPKQMRGVLSQKLQLDGIDFDGFVLKDNLRNLLRGRFRAIKEQVGYKLPALLRARAKADTESGETLFGDDAERDAFVYSLYADLLAERVAPDVLEEVLNIAGVYPDGRESIYAALDHLSPCDPVERIIIHLDRKSPPIRFEAYGSRVVPVYNYFQAALTLFGDGRLKANTTIRIGIALHRSFDFSVDVLLRSFQDMLRRGALNLETAQRLVDEVCDDETNEALVVAIKNSLAGPLVRLGTAIPPVVPDFPSLLRRELQRHRFEKSRRRRGWF